MVDASNSPPIVAHRSRNRVTAPGRHYSDRVLIRPMRTDDVDAVERLTAEAFLDLEVRTQPADWPTPQRRAPERSALWRRRMHHLLRHDGSGCWVAEDGDLVGVSASLKREGIWGLSTFGVRPEAQGRGVGTAVLEAALTYSRGCLRGIVCSTHDARAARRYRRAGFTLHPTMLLWGTIDRTSLPVIDRVRDGGLSDVDLCNSVDRQTRGSAHGADHAFMAAEMRLAVVDQTTGSGYCYIRPGGGPYLLAATNRRTATRLLWEALAAAEREPVSVHYLTPSQEWALDAGLAAGLQVHNHGYLALRNMKPPSPYLPSGHFL